MNRSQQKSTEVKKNASSNLDGVNRSQRRSTEGNKNAAPNLEGINKGQQRSTEVNTSQQHKSVGNREVNRGQQKSTEVNKNAFPNLEGIKRGQLSCPVGWWKKRVHRTACPTKYVPSKAMASTPEEARGRKQKKEADEKRKQRHTTRGRKGGERLHSKTESEFFPKR